MKNYIRVLLLIVFTLSIYTGVSAQNNKSITADQLQQEILKERTDYIETMISITETLPSLRVKDPQKAKLMVETYTKLLNDQLTLPVGYQPFSQDEVYYLLGHLNALAGNYSVATTNFSKLLNNVDLSADAREMLSALKYYQYLSLVQADTESSRTEANALIKTVLDNKEYGKYLPAYMLLWSDSRASAGDTLAVQQRLASFSRSSDIIQTSILPRKKQIFDRLPVIELKEFYNVPTADKAKSINTQIDAILADLNLLYKDIFALDGLLYPTEVSQLQKEENNLLIELKPDFENYRKTDLAYQQKIKEGELIITQLNSSSEYFGNLMSEINTVLETIQGYFATDKDGGKYWSYSDLELKRLQDLQRNIFLSREILSSIEEIEKSGKIPPDMDLPAMKAEYTKILEDDTRLKAQFYSDVKVGNPLFEEYTLLLDTYAEIYDDKELIDASIPAAKTNLSRTKGYYARSMADLQSKIAGEIAIAANESPRNDPLKASVGNIAAQNEYIELQTDYRILILRGKDFDKLPADTNRALREATLAELDRDRANYITRAQRFIDAHPNYQDFEQPSGAFLISNADLYYNMAELQYVLNVNDRRQALNYYNKVLELDPEHTFKERVLYNRGFISMVTTKDRINSTRSTDNAAAAGGVKFTAQEFRVAIDSFEDIRSNYPLSPLRDEAIYHLGTMYLLIAADNNAEASVYYTKANDCFNDIIAKTDSPYYYHALYQRGYVSLNQGTDYRSSIHDYTEILKAIEAGKISDPNIVKPYHQASIENIAFALIALDGQDFSKDALGAEDSVLRTDLSMDDYIAIMDIAARRKSEDLNAPKQAIDIMLAKIRKYPLSINNPTILDSTVVLWNSYYTYLDPATRQATVAPLDYRYARYLDIKRGYNQNSEWYKVNKDNKSFDAQLKVLDKVYATIEARLTNVFVQTPNHENLMAYQNHIKDYEAFAALHGDKLADRKIQWTKNLAQYSAFLADKSTDPMDWKTAQESLYAYNDNPNNKPELQYEGLAFKYIQSIYADQMPKLKAGGYTPIDSAFADTNKVYEYYVRGVRRFVTKLELPENKTAENQKLAEDLLLSLGDISFESGRYNEALMHYNDQLAKANTYTDPAVKRVALRNLYIKIAETHEAKKDYASAEANYRLALGVANDQADRDLIQNSISLQIQNSIDSSGSDKAKVGDEYIRLAGEFKSSNQQRYLGYMQEAKKAYIEANQTQKAIDVLMLLAGERQNKDEVYALSFEAWDLAQTKLNDTAQVTALQKTFTDRFPMSFEAYTLRVASIARLNQNPATREQAADAFVALHDEARAKTVNIGSDKPEDIYLWAIDSYRLGSNQEKLITNLQRFIQLYPNHSNVVPYMIYIADEYQKQGNTAEYEKMAKAIFQKDKTQAVRYQNIANAHLGRIAFEFDTAYIKASKNTEFVKADWDLVFAKRDEFKRTEATYMKEGLTFNSQSAYDNFAKAEKERSTIEAKIAFLKNYDTQLTAMENSGFISKTPATLITLNANTTWQNHLFGGKPNRVGALKPQVTAEVNKVIALIESGSKYTLDNQRRTRALNLISRINEHAANAIKTQVNRYFEIASEWAPYKNRNTMSQEEYDQLQGNLIAYSGQFANEYIAASYGAHIQVYNTYYSAGYNDRYTAYTVNKLQELKATPDYQKIEYPLGSGWDMSLEKGTANLSAQVGAVTSPNGIQMGSLNIPGGNAVIMRKTIAAKVQPEFGFVQMVFPFDAEIRINNVDVEASYVPTDTLTAGDPNTIRYALMIGAEYWTEGNNSIELKFPNKASEALPLMVSLQVITDKEKLAGAVSTEVKKYLTGPSWKAFTVNAATGAEAAVNTINATEFNVPQNKIIGMENSAAKAIWVPETGTARANLVVFEYEFDMDTMFREGFLSFVAPMEASIVLNGTEIAAGEALDYDPDPLVVYPVRVNFDAQNIVAGKNKLRVIVTNDSNFRGMLAEISITKTVKE